MATPTHTGTRIPVTVRPEPSPRLWSAILGARMARMTVEDAEAAPLTRDGACPLVDCWILWRRGREYDVQQVDLEEWRRQARIRRLAGLMRASRLRVCWRRKLAPGLGLAVAPREERTPWARWLLFVGGWALIAWAGWAVWQGYQAWRVGQ